MLLAVFAFLLVAYARLARSERGVLSGADRWLVALPPGPFLGWVTAANAVSLTSEAIRQGLVESGGVGEVLLGTVMVVLRGLLAAAVVLLGRDGPVQAYLACGVTVLWALVGIVVNQYDASPVTTVAAAVAAAPVVLAILGALRGCRPRPGAGRSARPGVA
jgi:hypothetical protein